MESIRIDRRQLTADQFWQAVSGRRSVFYIGGSVTSLFISSFILGIAFCAPPGIVTAETVRRGLARGFQPALLVQLGSIVGDSVWAAIALTGVNFLIQNRIANLILTILGMALLARLAFIAFRDALQDVEIGTLPTSGKSDLVTGVLLSLSNPFAIVFWLGVSTSVFSGLPGKPEWLDFVIFFTAFLLGTLLWCFFLAGLVAWGRRFITPAFFRWVNFVCGLALAYFSINLFIGIVSAMK
ncbi:MAG: LysE family transporter [Chloroflexi bacterium]|nr:LysE family transporter [Chloroflexota bacterium]